MISKKATTTVPIAELLAARWSPRFYDQNRRVERKVLVSLLEAARWAPSCYNEQPWRYLVCDKHQDSSAWNKALESLVTGNQRWAKRAPVLIVAVSDNVFAAKGTRNRWASYDTGAASENMCLQACCMGLAVHQMGGFDSGLLRQSFGIPDRFDPIAVIAVGYPEDPELLSEQKRETEYGPRSRRPLERVVFESGWNKPFSISS